MPLQLSSPAFESGKFIPPRYAQNGEGFSPPLQWKGAPEGTKSFALMLDDPDAPGGVRTHWVIYDLYKTISELPEHIPRHDVLPEWTYEGISARQGKNDYDRIGYYGPEPTKAPPHHYTFTLYALDCQLHVPVQGGKANLLAAMSGHILETADLVGLYTE